MKRPLHLFSYWVSLFVTSLLATSCALYPKRASYELVDSYPSVKSQLLTHHHGLQRNMSIFQDGESTLVREKDKRMELVELSHAPEVSHPIIMYRAVLEPQGTGSRLQIVTGTAQGSGFLNGIDRWVTSTLRVKSRIIDEDRSVAPRSIWY